MAYDFKASDLKAQNYKLTAKQEGDNPKIVGSPDKQLVDRNERYEVLYFIKRYVEKRSWHNLATKQQEAPNIATGQKVERLLHQCPSNLRSREHIESWIEANW